MSYNGFVVQVNTLRPHPNADRLQIATFFGCDTCVDLNVKINDWGIYFPSDGQLSLDYCLYNHLLKKLPDGTPDIGYMDPNKRNVTAIRLRGERSDGIFMPLESLNFIEGINIEDFKEVGQTISVVNGVEICTKYIPKTNPKSTKNYGNTPKIKRKDFAPLFKEHVDTEQLAYNLKAFNPGDRIEITLKMHGTSQRTGYLPVLKKYKRSIFDRIFMRPGKPIYEYDYVTGTRRTVLENFEGGFYGSNSFRKQHEDKLRGKLQKGETVYYEVVSFTDNGTPIMGVCDNKKTHDKDFIKLYGDTTTFHYGNEVGHSEMYVYRMTMTNEDGFVVEYDPDFMRLRCEQMGVKTVPVFWKGYIPEEIDIEMKESPEETAGEWVINKAEEFYDGPDPIGKTHVREGVVVRILNRPKFTAYKHKNFFFKCLENIIKIEADAPDMEEAEEEFKEVE